VNVLVNFSCRSLYHRPVDNISSFIPVAARSEACVCDRSLAGNASSNPGRDMEVLLLRCVDVHRKITLK